MTTTEYGEQGRVLDFGAFPGRWEITRSTEDTNGELFETRWELDAVPGDGPFAHTHPDATESFEALSGVLEVNVERAWTEVSAGEKHTVPPGPVHTFRNKTPVELRNVHEPALAYEEYFRRFHRLATERGVSLPPDGLGDVLLLAMPTTESGDEFRAVSPPQWAFRGPAGPGPVLGYDLPPPESVGTSPERTTDGDDQRYDDTGRERVELPDQPNERPGAVGAVPA